jgi:diguanylate cyclase
MGSNAGTGTDIREIENLIKSLAIGRELKQALLEKLETQKVSVRDVLKDLATEINRVLEIDPAADAHLPQFLEQSLLKVMETLHVPADLLNDFSRLAGNLEKGVDSSQWTTVLDGFSDLATRSIRAIAAEKNDLEEFLRQITSQITEMEGFVEVAQSNVASTRVSTLKIRDEVDLEVSGLARNVSEAKGIDQVKGLLSSHIQKIRAQMKDYVEVEERRLKEVETNNHNLTEKLALLDSETSKLRTQLEQKHQQLLIDPLTRISNRFAWDERYRLEYERWKRNQNNLCLAIWDIDKFKSINDEYGHNAGDRVLKLIAKVIDSRVRKTDFFARIGGEEFVMLLPDTAVNDSLAVLDILRQYVAECPFNFHGKAVTITISCGVTALREGDSMEMAFERADKGLYMAKQQGRNRVIIN